MRASSTYTHAYSYIVHGCMHACIQVDGVHNASISTVDALFSPLQQPVELIDQLFIAPVRREVVDSLSSFVNQRCVVRAPAMSIEERLSKLSFEGTSLPGLIGTLVLFARTACPALLRMPALVTEAVTKELGGGHDEESGQRAPQKRYVSMHALRRRYEQFCFMRGLKLEEDLVRLRRRLISEFDVRPHSKYTTRVYGLQWTTPHPPFLSLSFSLDQVHVHAAFHACMHASLDQLRRRGQPLPLCMCMRMMCMMCMLCMRML